MSTIAAISLGRHFFFSFLFHSGESADSGVGVYAEYKAE